jgi:hypothetical protein
VTRQGDPAVFDGAGVQEVNEQPLPLTNTDRVPGPKRLVVDRVGVRADLEAIRVGVQGGWLFEQRTMMGVVVLIVHGRGKEGLPIA